MVKFFRNNQAQPETPSQITKRLKAMDTQSVMLWWDTCHMNLGAAFDKWRYHKGPWEPVQENLEALAEMSANLRHRSDLN
jgi:hypothetical protein